MTEKTTSPKAKNRKNSKKTVVSQTTKTRRPKKNTPASEAADVSDLAQGSSAQQSGRAQMRGPQAPPNDKPKTIPVTNKPADTR